MKRNGLTIVEILVIVTVIIVLLALLAPAVSSARESARINQCKMNLRQVGIAAHNYHDGHKSFPAVSQLVGGEKKTAGGYSFLTALLPFMEQQKLFDSLPKDDAIDPLGSNAPNLVKARATRLPGLICPSNSNASVNKEGQALTNYKAMCATSAESLRIAVDPTQPAPYGDANMHPDGAWRPGKSIRIADFSDGTSDTLLFVETMDDTNSAWIAGSDVHLVGMPKAESYDQEFSNGTYFAPTSFNGKYDEEAGDLIRQSRTYLQFDFSPNGKDSGTYPDSVGRHPAYGPGSAHVAGVNHVYGDASVRSITRKCDYAAYMIAITRQNGDPCYGD